MKKTIILIHIVFAILFLQACGNSSPAKAEEKEEHGHQEHENENSVELSDQQIKSIKLELGGIEKKQLTTSLKANGILKVPNQNRATATAMMGGVVKSILVQTGNAVKRGQVIATIANTSFITMQEDYISVSSKVALAELEYNRQKELQAGKAGTLKILQQAESELNVLKARKASLSRQLELVGISSSSLTSDNIHSVVNILSPISGSVSSVHVNIGSFVDANNPIIEVIDNSQLHLDLFVYEKDLYKLRDGQTIHFTLTNNPGKEYDAKIYAISNTFEQNTKAIAVHATVEGEKSGLIDGMNITALVSLENATVNAVPSDAIVSYQGNDFIFILSDAHAEEEHEHKVGQTEEKEDEHGHHHGESEDSKTDTNTSTYEMIPVRKGTTDVGYSEITLLKDIPLDSKVVVKGAFFLLAKKTNSGEHEH